MKTLAWGHCGLKNVAKYLGEIGFIIDIDIDRQCKCYRWENSTVGVPSNEICIIIFGKTMIFSKKKVR